MDCIRLVNLLDGIDNLQNRRPKLYKQRKDPFQLSDNEFKYRYRFSKATIIRIVDIVKDDLQLSKRGGGTSVTLQVLTALRCWGRREVQDDAGDLHGLSQVTVSRICSRVARAIAKLASEYVSMPNSLEEEARIMAEFKKIRNFPRVIGAIDCTHIKIKKVGGDLSQFYINRKGFYS